MDKKIKVLFLATADNIHTVKWVNSLSDFFEIHLVYCKGHGENLNKIDKRVVLHELKYKAPIGYYLNAIQLRKLFYKISPNLINVHYASGYGTLVRIAKIKPVLLSIWGSDIYDFPNESFIKKRILQKNVQYAEAIASTSNVMANELKRQVPNLKQEIYITPFGVDIEKFKSTDKTKDSRDFKIGNVKTLKNSIYGIDYGILAFKKLKNNLMEANEIELANSLKLYIYGDGEDKKDIERLIISNNLENDVFLMGKVPNDKVPDILNELDVFCITSNKESFGVSVVEAMACGLPIVATDAEGFCEVMEDKKTGYIVEKKNVEAIAKALELLVKNEKLRKDFGQEGRKKVIEHYDWKKNVENMKKIYNHIAKEK